MPDNRESVKIADWLAARVPPPPPALAEHIARIVDDLECDRSEIANRLVDAAERILKSIGDGRDSANDLLAADALVTYAMEAAADGCGDIESAARESAERLSRLGSSA